MFDPNKEFVELDKIEQEEKRLEKIYGYNWKQVLKTKEEERQQEIERKRTEHIVKIISEDIEKTGKVSEKNVGLLLSLSPEQRFSFFNSTSNSPLKKAVTFLDSVIDKLNIPRNELMSVTGGYTGILAMKSREYFLKVDKPSRLEHEWKVYQAHSRNKRNLKILPQTTAIKINSSESKNIFDGVLVLKNIDNHYEHNRLRMNLLDLVPFWQWTKKRDEYFSQSELNSIADDTTGKYPQLLAALFHEQMKDTPEIMHADKYCRLDGKTPHYAYIDTPSIELNKLDPKALELFHKSNLDPIQCSKLEKIIKKIIENPGKDIIHSDFKEENIANSYLIDFSTVCRGYPEEDVIYYAICYNETTILEPVTKLIPEIKTKISQYHAYRKKINNNYIPETSIPTEDLILKILVLRHSVMDKRDLLNPKYYKIRDYYKTEITTLLSNYH